MKLEALDPKVFKPELFENKRCYEAALYAVSICNNIIAKANSGHLVLEYEQIVKPKFEIDEDGLFVRDSEHSRVWIIGDMTNDKDKIYCTKRDVREYFKLWRICKITNVTKAYDLTR